MSKKEIEDLKAAYNAVFDEKDRIRTCGRCACMNLINLMKKYTSENVGNPDTGSLEVNAIQAEYHRLIA